MNIQIHFCLYHSPPFNQHVVFARISIDELKSSFLEVTEIPLLSVFYKVSDVKSITGQLHVDNGGYLWLVVPPATITQKA